MTYRNQPSSECLESLAAELAGFRLVYQGGHHSVFCDGKAHKATNGGYTKIEQPSKVMRTFPCDCSRWQGGAR